MFAVSPLDLSFPPPNPPADKIRALRSRKRASTSWLGERAAAKEDKYGNIEKERVRERERGRKEKQCGPFRVNSVALDGDFRRENIYSSRRCLTAKPLENDTV